MNLLKVFIDEGRAYVALLWRYGDMKLSDEYPALSLKHKRVYQMQINCI